MHFVIFFKNHLLAITRGIIYVSRTTELPLLPSMTSALMRSMASWLLRGSLIHHPEAEEKALGWCPSGQIRMTTSSGKNAGLPKYQKLCISTVSPE